MTTLPVLFHGTALRSLIFLALGLATAGGHAATISRGDLSFQVELPVALEDVSELQQFRGELVALIKWTEDREGFVRLFSISDMAGVIGREHLSNKDVPQPGVTVELARWKSFDVDVIRIPETAGAVNYVTFNAQIPLKPRAIQLRVAGLASDETDLRVLLARTLASLDGPTNWLTVEQRAESLARGIGSLAVIGGVIFYLVRKIRRGSQTTRAPDGGNASNSTSAASPD